MTAIMAFSVASCGGSSLTSPPAGSSDAADGAGLEQEADAADGTGFEQEADAADGAEAETEAAMSESYEDVWAPDESEAETGIRIAASDIKVGLICLGGDDSPQAAAHIEGLTKACESLGIDPGTQTVIRKNVPEDAGCYDNAVALVGEGCNIIFSTSRDHQKYMQQAATEYPDVTFVSCAGDHAALYELDNYKNMYPCAFESRYVSGIAAGMKLAEMVGADPALDPYVGYVGAFPYPEVVSGMTAFFLGVRTVVPIAHMDVKYTNSWCDPEAEAAAAKKLMSGGCQVIGYHADSTSVPSAVQAAREDGKNVYCVGYEADVRDIAPDSALTSARNNWAVLYGYVLSCLTNGNTIPVDYSAGAESDAVMISELGGACAEGTQNAVDTAWQGIRDGSLQVFDTTSFTCPPSLDGSYTVDGKGVVTSAFGLDLDGDLINDSGEAVIDEAFMESALRSAPYFSLRINGITEVS